METAIAIVLAAGVFIAVFIAQKKKDRAAAVVESNHLCVAIERAVGDVANASRGTQFLLGKMRTDMQEANAALAPLCESLAEAIVASKPDPVDLAPLVETVANLDLSFHQHYDDQRLRNTIRAVAFPADDLKQITEILAPLVQYILPRMDTLDAQVGELQTRVETSGQKVLRVP